MHLLPTEKRSSLKFVEDSLSLKEFVAGRKAWVCFICDVHCDVYLEQPFGFTVGLNFYKSAI